VTIRAGDFVEAGGGAGRVVCVRGNSVEVQPSDRPSLRFWYKATDVKLGSPEPRMTPMAWRYAQEARVEVRAVCSHLNLAELCAECGGGKPEEPTSTGPGEIEMWFSPSGKILSQEPINQGPPADEEWP